MTTVNKNIKIPYHLGIIIDGNRRWAKERGLPIFEGHRRGLYNVKKIGEYIYKKGVKILTVYTFSSENWNRCKTEVNYLMKLIEKVFSKAYIDDLIKKEIRLKVIGQKEKLSASLRKKIKKTEESTKKGKKGILNLAISYGGRLEIVQAVKKIIAKKTPANKINEEVINQNLWTEGLPYPDLIIRTGKEKRLSNFLIWQAAYSELYFADKYWPDFNEKDLDQAFLEYSQRERRFGK